LTLEEALRRLSAATEELKRSRIKLEAATIMYKAVASCKPRLKLVIDNDRQGDANELGTGIPGDL